MGNVERGVGGRVGKDSKICCLFPAFPVCFLCFLSQPCQPVRTRQHERGLCCKGAIPRLYSRQDLQQIALFFFSVLSVC